MKCVHEVEKNGVTFCDLDACEQCIGMYPEHQKTDCQYCETKEDIEAKEYLESLTSANLEEIANVH